MRVTRRCRVSKAQSKKTNTQIRATPTDVLSKNKRPSKRQALKENSLSKVHTNKAPVKRSRRWYRTKLFKVGIFCFTLILIGIWWIGGSFTLGERIAMEKYLQNKYHKSFSVGSAEATGWGFAIEGSFKSVAYPMGEPGLKFQVSGKDGKYRDGYLKAIWERDELPRLQNFARVELKYPISNISLKIGYYDLSGTRLSNEQEGSLPSLMKAASLVPDTITYSPSAIVIDKNFDEHIEDHYGEMLKWVYYALKTDNVVSLPSYVVVPHDKVYASSNRKAEVGTVIHICRPMKEVVDKIRDGAGIDVLRGCFYEEKITSETAGRTKDD